MLSRLWTNLVILGSLAALGGVAAYLYGEYRHAEQRHRFLVELKRLVDEEGPCAGLEKVHEAAALDDPDLQRSVESRRPALVTRIVGEADTRGRDALLSADREGLIDRTLCEQILLARELGEHHPVLELLRFTRGAADACENPEGLGRVLSSLGSHRSMMVHALLAQAGELDCLPPWLAGRLATMAVSLLREQPDAMDDLDVLRVAHFLETWAPVEAAQLGCRAELMPERSLLTAALGCTEQHKNRILPRYRYAARTAAPGEPAPAEGLEVLLLGREGERCEVRTCDGPPRRLVVPCRDLSLVSELQVATLIETPRFGLVRAGLIAGMAHYDGATGKLEPSRRDPEVASWYAYTGEGKPLGVARPVDLEALAGKLGEQLPDHPLNAYCRQKGARYCYDVDWARLVGRVPGHPLVYLSRPAAVFARPYDPGPDGAAALFDDAFGKPMPPGRAARAYELGAGTRVVAAAEHGSVDLRWRLTPSGPWHGQHFGAEDGGVVSSSARLVSVLDLRGDGTPQLLLRRVLRSARDGTVRESSDELVLLALEPSGTRFQPVSVLTVREY